MFLNVSTSCGLDTQFRSFSNNASFTVSSVPLLLGDITLNRQITDNQISINRPELEEGYVRAWKVFLSETARLYLGKPVSSMQSRATKMLRITKEGSHEPNDVHCTDDWVTKKKENIYIDIRVNDNSHRRERMLLIFRSKGNFWIFLSVDSHEIKEKGKIYRHLCYASVDAGKHKNHDSIFHTWEEKELEKRKIVREKRSVIHNQVSSIDCPLALRQFCAVRNAH